MANPGVTDDQKREALEAFEKHGSVTAAAQSLGLHESTYRNRLNQARMDEGQKVKGTSTLYDEEGNVKLQWVKVDEDQQRREELFKEAMEALAKDLPRVTVKPPKPSQTDLMACYPISDHHTGAFADRDETGESDYNLEIAESLLIGAIDHLIAAAPDCEEAVVPIMGDFFHYDGSIPETPTHKNKLDPAGRFNKMIQVGVRIARYAPEAAARKHKRVRVIPIPGNHDPFSAIFLAVCLANIYENEPRIAVDTSSTLYRYFRFGKCLVGLHHGHGAKLADLPLIMATDRPEDWGETEYRYCWTGHIHHDSVKEYPGCKVESFRVLGPNDAHHAGKGYRSGRDMKAIILHREFGEVARHTVNPEMLK